MPKAVIIVFGYVLFLLVAVAPAQTQTAAELTAQARRTYAEQGPRPALPEFERALTLYRQAGDRHGEAIVLGYIGNCHKRLGDLPRALDYLRRALAMKQELGDRLEEGKTFSHLGLLYWEMGEYAKAIDQLTRSIAIARQVEDPQLEAAALNNLSLVYDEQGDYHHSLGQYRRALELHRATSFAQGESATLGNIGGVYLLLGQYREAMRYYEQALAISERLNIKPSASQDLGNLALCHLGLGEVPEALSSFDRALALAREAGLKKEEADWHKGKGSALLRVGKYDQALEEYRQALHDYEQAGLKRELIEALGDVGNLHALLGDTASAEQDFRRAIDLARAIGHPRGVTVNLLALGDLEARRKRYEQAEALYLQALQRAREADDRVQMSLSLVQLAFTHRDQKRLAEGSREAKEALEIAQAIGARLVEAQARYALGDIARGQGLFKDALQHYTAGEEIAAATGEPELGWRLAYGQGQVLEALQREEEAIAAYRRAVIIIETVRDQLREERFRAGYIEDKYQVYAALVRLLLKRGQASQAFSFAEKLRARSYLDLLNHGMPHHGGAREIELREKIRQLQRALSAETAKPGTQQRSEALAIFSEELESAERAYQALLDDLRSSDPAYAAARSLAVPSSEQVQKLLPAGTALVEYVVSDESVSIFVLTAGQLEAKTVPVHAVDLQTKVELLRDLIARRGTNAWQKPARSLRSLLIGPIEQEGWLKGITRLYLVPHGILHYLPFSVLVQGDDSTPRFLVEDYTLAHLPAAAALVHGPKAASVGRSLFALAPARAHLRFAEQEARNVAEFFPGKSLLLVGTRAKEASFKRSADHYQVLHFATHGYFNKFNPLFSGLELESGEGEDGRLEVHEILGLRLDARLVTLSACETALGSGFFTEVPVGDDFVGLTRAFLFAGSSSVLASLWEVNDRSTSHLMRRFYSHLRQDDTPTALARAMREVRRESVRYRHPYYWGPFVLVGQMN